MFSYKDALEYHTSITKPPRSEYWRITLQDDARPLNGTGTRNKSIHKRGDGTVYFRLYDTNIAMFYPVDPVTNTYTVVMRYYNSVTTRKFMCDYGLNYHFIDTANGRVQIPYVHTDGNLPSAILTFNAPTNRLITDLDKSWHPRVYTAVKSDEQKQSLKYLRKKLEPFMTLAMFNIDNIMDQSSPDERYAQPFHDITRWAYNADMEGLVNLRNDVRRNMGRFISEYQIDAVMNDTQFIDNLMRAMPAIMTLYLSHAATRFERQTFETERKIINFRTALAAVSADLSPEAFAKYVTKRMEWVFGFDRGAGQKYQPLFQESLPRRTYVDWRDRVPAQFSRYC